MPGETAETDANLKVKLVETKKGWYFQAGKVKAGPFCDPNEADLIDVAALLSDKTSEVEDIKKLLELDSGEYTEAIKEWSIKPRDVHLAKIARKGLLYIKIGLGKLEAKLVGKPVEIEAIIAGKSQRKAVPQTITASCPLCDEHASTTLKELAERYGVELVLQLIRGPWIVFRKNYTQILNSTHPVCRDPSKPHRWFIDKKDYEDYAVLHVRDSIRSQEDLETKEFNTIPIFLVGQVLNGCSKAGVKGVAAVDPKTQNLTIVADSIEHLESEIMGYKVTEDDKRHFQHYFIENNNLETDLEISVRPEVIERYEPKLAIVIALHTPIFIPLGNKVIRGCPRVNFYGDTKTCKSMLLEYVSKFLQLGEYAVAETSSRTGILYTIDSDSKTLIWGVIPQNDLGVAVIDGLNKLNPDELSRFRETLEKMTLKVHRMVSGERLCRTRIIAAFNPKSDLQDYVCKCYGLTREESECFAAPPDYTRWDLWIPFDKTDVAPKRFGEGYTRNATIPLEVLKNSMMWAMSRRQNQVVIPDNVFERIEEVAGEFIERYACSQLPIVHNGYIEVVARVSVGFAGLYHSTDETHEKIIVKQSHVEKTKKYLQWMIEANEYDQYVEWTVGKKELTPEEKEEILDVLGNTICRGILQTLAKGTVQCSTLAGKYKVTERWIKDRAKELKGLGLIDSGFKGYKLLPKGVRVVKEYLLNKDVNENFTSSPKEDIPPEKKSKQEKLGGVCKHGEQVNENFTKTIPIDGLNGKEEAAGGVPLKPKDEAVKPLNDQAIDKAFPPLGMAETLILLRSKWSKGNSKEFLDLIHEVRADLTREEAGTLFAKLIEEGAMTYDPDGWLVWVEPSGPLGEG